MGKDWQEQLYLDINMKSYVVKPQQFHIKYIKKETIYNQISFLLRNK